VTDKIRIVGEFGEDVVARVEEFAASLTGVKHVEVLRNGTELFANGAKDAGVPVTETPDETETATPAEYDEPEAASTEGDAA
jgi:hypothetical protein